MFVGMYMQLCPNYVINLCFDVWQVVDQQSVALHILRHGCHHKLDADQGLPRFPMSILANYLNADTPQF